MSLNTPQSPQLETVSKRSPFGALLNRTLPSYTGLYPVGVCDVELPVPRQTFGTFKHRKLPGAEAGLAMDTVLFSLFYPAETCETNKRVVWFPKLGQTIDGFLRMASRTPNFFYRLLAYPLAAAAIYGTTFPAQPNTPMRAPPASEDPLHPAKRWPLMIFSHGVGCSRFMYSAFCGEMASRGYVVAAIEHRDGTSPSSTIVTEGGKRTNIDWLSWTDLYWPDLQTQPSDDTTLRHEQIKLRVTEIHEVLKAMDRIARGENVTPTSIHSPDFDWRRWKSVDTAKPIMAGHSLGGSAAIAAAADSRFDFGSVLAFDPAVQRLEPWESPITPPLLIVNSDEFTQSDEFVRLSKLVQYASFPLVFSIAGATHPSFSDVFLILPSYVNRLTGLRVDSDQVLYLCIHAVCEFLKGDGEALKERAEMEQGAGTKASEGIFRYHKV